MDYVLPILTGLSLSACLGFRAFLPPFILGMVYHFFPSTVHINESFAFLSKEPVLIALGVATLLEFLGDKIPWVDHFLDQAALPAKLALSVILSLALIPGANHWFYLLIAVVFSTGTTLTVHAGKTGIRASSTAMTGGMATPVVGVIEDAITIIGSFTAILLPVAAIIFIAILCYKCLKYLFGNKGGDKGTIAQTQTSLFLYSLTRYFFLVFFKIYNRIEISGQENIPSKTPFIVVANHASTWDGFILIQGLRVPLYIMVKKEAYRNPIVGWYLRKVLTFPVDRNKIVDTSAIKKSIKILANNHCLGIFPEGTRSKNGKVREFKHGAIKFAMKKMIPIVPAYISNSHMLTPNGSSLPHPVKLSITYLPVLDTKAAIESGKTEKEILEDLYEEICCKGSEIMGYDVRDIEQDKVTEN